MLADKSSSHTAPSHSVRGLRKISTLYDSLQRLTNASDSRGAITYTYSNLDLARVVDRIGFTNSYAYDSMRRKVAEANALGATTLYNYCSCGSLNWIQDAASNRTYFFYDNLGRTINVAYPDLFSVTNNYNLLGQLTNVIDSAGSSTTNWFNNQGLQIAVSNAFGLVSRVIYDALDRATNTVDANGVSVSTTYDNLNRPLSRTYPDNGAETFGYTFDVSAMSSYTNQIGNLVLYAYDPAGRKTNEIYPGVMSNSFAYSPVGDLLTLNDGKNQTTTWSYDQYGRVTNKHNRGTNLFLYSYDPNNRMTNRTSAAKGAVTYLYDAAGNLTNIGYPVNAPIKMAYDLLDRMTNMVDTLGTTRYSYDAASQLLSEGGLWPFDSLSFAYLNRQRAWLSLAQASARPWTQGYTYDAAKRLTGLTSPAGTFSYAYDPICNLQVRALTLPNGAYITNNYDSVARLLSTALTGSGGSPINSHAYSYNPGNQRTQQVFTAGNLVNYSYDPTRQLKAAVGKEQGGLTNRLQEQFGYTYDAVQNLYQRTNNALVETFNVNSLNELTTETNAGTLTVAGTTTGHATSVTVNGITVTNYYMDNIFAKDGFTLANGNNSFSAIAQDSYGRRATNTAAVNLPGTNTFNYDLSGDLLSDGLRNFAYDDENQLISVWVTNVWRSDFIYDGKMRRRVRIEYTWGGSSWLTNTVVRYIYDGNVVIQERWLTAQLLAEGAFSYTRGRDLSGGLQEAGGIGGLLAWTDNGQLLSPASGGAAHAYYHCDGNGNITCLINSSNTVVGKYEYGPFGVMLSQSGGLADANLYRFSSKEFHTASTLSYYLYRFYDPSLQRWLDRDPAEEWGGVNLYAQAPNDPINRVDARGLMTMDQIEATTAELDAEVSQHACCCSGSAAIKFDITWAPSSGTTVAGKALPDFQVGSGCVKNIYSYYWWTCYEAIAEGGNNSDAQGWTPDGSVFSYSASPGWKGVLWPAYDPYDRNNIAMAAEVIAIVCSGGHEHAVHQRAGKQLVWAWDPKEKTWTGPAPGFK